MINNNYLRSYRNKTGFTLTKAKRTESGFTLIELLVVVSIMGILLALSVFGMQGARQSSRDGRRKADLEQIRSGLEMYKSDCGVYPATLTGSSLVGSGTPSSCSSDNIYIASIPKDPLSTQTSSIDYAYSSNGATYTICSSLEQTTAGYFDSSGCGSCGSRNCNYKVVNP